jgi:hypothetical protein
VRTEVKLPARQYPGGYRYAVRGARVTSRRGSSVLRLATCAGTGEVRVRVVAADGRRSRDERCAIAGRRRAPRFTG